MHKFDPGSVRVGTNESGGGIYIARPCTSSQQNWDRDVDRMRENVAVIDRRHAKEERARREYLEGPSLLFQGVPKPPSKGALYHHRRKEQQAEELERQRNWESELYNKGKETQDWARENSWCYSQKESDAHFSCAMKEWQLAILDLEKPVSTIPSGKLSYTDIFVHKRRPKPRRERFSPSDNHQHENLPDKNVARYAKVVEGDQPLKQSSKSVGSDKTRETKYKFRAGGKETPEEYQQRQAANLSKSKIYAERLGIDTHCLADMRAVSAAINAKKAK